MIGVILAAGMGTRLRPLTDDIPKALLEINNITLLERMIKNCIDADISKFIVVVGYYKSKVIDLCNRLSIKYNIEFSIVENEEYEVTNTSVSTYLASKIIADNPEDFILINGDNVVDKNIIRNITGCNHTGMIIDNFKKLNEESFKVIIKNEKLNSDKTIATGELSAIGKQLDISSSQGEFIGVSKVISDDIDDFNKILENLIDENPQNYYDFAYKELCKIKVIDFVLTNGLKWTEIDDYNDWEIAQKLVNEFEKD